MTDDDVGAVVVPQAELAAGGRDRPQWQREAFGDIALRLTDPAFPCVFSRNAFRKSLLRFVFVPGSSNADLERLARGLSEYVDEARRWDGCLDTAYPLVVVFSTGALPPEAELVRCHAFGWEILSRLADLDPESWPADVPTTPSDPAWSMCFRGMQLFVNMSAPAHRQRLSRNLGRRFALVVNPRERFDVFAGDSPSGRHTRATIRRRVDKYDDVPRSPILGSFGGDSLEWRQYGLPDDNAVAPSGQCPFEATRPHHSHESRGASSCSI